MHSLLSITNIVMYYVSIYLAIIYFLIVILLLIIYFLQIIICFQEWVWSSCLQEEIALLISNLYSTLSKFF